MLMTRSRRQKRTWSMPDPNYLRSAQKCRELAATAHTDDARVVLLQLADDYERGLINIPSSLKPAKRQMQ